MPVWAEMQQRYQIRRVKDTTLQHRYISPSCRSSDFHNPKESVVAQEGLGRTRVLLSTLAAITPVWEAGILSILATITLVRASIISISGSLQ